MKNLMLFKEFRNMARKHCMKNLNYKKLNLKNNCNFIFSINDSLQNEK